MGPVSIAFNSANGGRASKTVTLPTALRHAEPDLLAIRCGGDVRAERALLRPSSNDPVIGNRHDDRFRGERGADVAILPIGREDLHARAARNLDAGTLLIRRAVEDGD